jgi:hypothetical protein
MEQTDNALEVAAADEDEYEVGAIVDHRAPRKNAPKSQLEFRVRWKGYEPEEDTWLRYSDVVELEALDVYAREHPELRL